MIAKGEKSWKTKTVEHKGFKDLGNYVIELPDFTDPSTLERGIAAVNYMCDHGEMGKIGCTCMAKHNSNGDVVVGRNMDLEISQKPAYVFSTTYGKYKNVCVSYAPTNGPDYEDVQKLDELDPNLLAFMVYGCCDALNEKGLYAEVDLRESNPRLSCYGLHSKRGETHRDDGTPWSELRACTISTVQLVTQNCATVQEAVEFLKNSYDWYTITAASDDPNRGSMVDNCNMALMVGDATGEFGVIEIAQDEVRYFPYQFGHANFYIDPVWACLDTCGAGLGRLAKVPDVIQDVETLEDAMDAMKPIMWKNETLYIGEAYRADEKTHPNPFRQIVFQDDRGNPSLDYRNEYVGLFPVLDDDRLIATKEEYEIAEKSTYDPRIKQYFDEAIARGNMVVDDGSFVFDILGEKVPFADLVRNYKGPEVFASQPEKSAAMYNEYVRLRKNENCYWGSCDPNFEALKAMAYAQLHVRYDEDGNFDPSCMSKYEKLKAYYGDGVPKDEEPLRDDAEVWTTSLNIGVNCAKREMKIRFWENDDVIYHVSY